MGVNLRVVAYGRDNGTEIAIIKRFTVDAEPGETPQQTAQRIQRQAQAGLRDFMQDALEVAISDTEVSVGLNG